MNRFGSREYQRMRHMNNRSQFDDDFDHQNDMPGPMGPSRLTINDNLNVDKLIQARNEQPSNPHFSRSMESFQARVTFKAVLPREQYENGASVRLVFFAEHQAYDQPLNIDHQTNIERKFCQDNQIMYLITANATLPISLNQIGHDDLKICYYYTMTHSRLGPLYEDNLLRNRRVRYFDVSRHIEKKGRHGKRIRNENLDIDVIDGLVAFDTGVVIHNYNKLKKNTLDCVLPLDYLNNPVIIESNINVINQIKSVHRSLCDDKDYKIIFEEILTENFSLTLQSLNHKFKNGDRNLENWEYLVLLNIFNYISDYDFSVSGNRDYLQLIFSMHNCNRIQYLASLSTLFSDSQKERLATKLDDFLKLNQSKFNSTAGINALIIRYFLSQKSLASEEFNCPSSITNKLGLQISSDSELRDYLNRYENLFKHDPNVGALFMNYFSINVELTQYFIESKKIPVQSFVYFLVIVLKDSEEDKFERRFQNEYIKHFIPLIMRYIRDKIFDESDKSQVNFMLLSKSSRLILDRLVQKFTKETDTIVEAIQLILNLAQIAEKFYIPTQEFSADIDNLAETLDSVIVLIKKWFSTECNESLLLSYGVDKRNENEIRERRSLIEEYKRLASEKDRPNRSTSIVQEDEYFDGMMGDEMYYTMEDRINPNFRRQRSNQIDRVDKLQDILRRIEYYGVSNEYELYSKMLKISYLTNNSQLERDFKREILKLFKKRIDDRIKVSLDEVIKFRIRFNFQKFSIIEDDFKNVIDNRVVSLLTDTDNTNDLQILCNCLRENNHVNQSFLQYYIDAVLVKKWPKKSDRKDSHSVIFKFILEWNSFLAIAELNYQSLLRNYSRPLNDEWNLKFNNTLTILASTIDNIITGNETIEHIRLLNSNYDQLFNIAKFLIIANYNKIGFKHLQSDNMRNFKNLFETRVRECKEFDKYRENLRKFIFNFCRVFENKLDVEVYERKLGEFSSYEHLESSVKLAQVCNCYSFDRLPINLPTYQPLITCFTGIGDVYMGTIERIIALERQFCKIFDDYFNQSCDKKGSRLNIDEILNIAWPETLARWKELSTSIQNGTIKLIEIDEIANRYFSKNHQLMERELLYIIQYFKINDLKRRNSQIKLYNRFKSSYETALTIEELRVKLKMKQNFHQLDDLLSINSEAFKSWTLEKMDKRVEETIDVLDKMNDAEKLHCLRAYSNSLEIVEWLRKNANSLGELKFLVDLASMSSSNDTNTATNIDRTVFAKTLKEAGTAFASLIYELKDTDDFSTFMALSINVCSHLESDRNIANKLIGVSDKVPLLEEIKKMKGNVELNSLKQAKQINESGVYQIGFIQPESSDSEISFKNSYNISDLIKLEIVIQNQPRQYKFEQLKELQSILMLVAPRKTSKSEDDQGMEVEEESGASEDESATLEYFIEIFSAVIRLAEVFLNLVKNGCFFFENFIAEIHCDFSNKLRSSSMPCLILKKFSDQLSNITDSTIDSVNNLCSLMEDTFNMWSGYIGNLRDHYPSLNYYTINQIKFLSTTIKKCLSNQVNERSVSFEIVKNVLYNLNENDDHELTLNELFDAYNRSFNVNDTLSLEIDLKLKNLKEGSFYKSFNNIWISFISEQNTISKQQFISFRHLCIILEILSERKHDFKRRIPGYLSNRGKPNLIICPTRDQIPIILSIYALSPEQPLPNNSEILNCTQHTTSEEIENFLRIVFRSNGERIYCLMNIQDLTYESSAKFENFMMSNSSSLKNKTEDFVLAVFCSTEKQSQSTIASIFNKNRIKPIISPSESIERYLNSKLFKQKLHVTSSKQDFYLYNYDRDFSCVRTLLSQRSGNGKSKYVDHLVNKMVEDAKHLNREPNFNKKTVRIKSTRLDMDKEIEKLINYKLDMEKENKHNQSTIYHIDIAYEVFHNVDYYLFYLIVCSYLKHSNGLVWRRGAKKDLYLIEMAPPYYDMALSRQINAYYNSSTTNQNVNINKPLAIHSMLNYLPKIEFRTPQKYLYDLRNDPLDENKLSDNLYRVIYHHKEKYQRVCYYLKLVADIRATRAQKKEPVKFVVYEANRDARLNQKFDPAVHVFNEVDTLDIILGNSELRDPTWHELRNFVNFLNSQLCLLEKSELLNRIEGIKALCLQLLMIMANDFGLSSLNTFYDENPTENAARNDINGRDPNQVLRRDESNSGFDFTRDNQIKIAISKFEINENRRWENMIHPYMILNPTGDSVTFIGVYLDRTTKSLINPNTNRALSTINPNIPPIDGELFLNLLRNRVPLFDNFNNDIREKKLLILGNVMGIDMTNRLAGDPDSKYELTMDNCLKMMAIYLRFVCNNPVVIMGETGCGKTSLIKFFSSLHLRGQKLILTHVKIHGGTTASELEKQLRVAEELSKKNYYSIKESADNKTDMDKVITSLLFFDEANTTEEVGLIKEIMCDLTCHGRPIDFTHGLKIVAAVNPYRKHSDEMINKLENAGLGFYVSNSDTKEKLGHIPMRQLVYRVQPLPSSMIPLVWDFGQLDKTIEAVYIKQLIRQAIVNNLYNIRIDEEQTDAEIDLLCELLNKSQEFMRSRNDECSFVSIRDIERVIKVSSWFLSKTELIFDKIDSKQIANIDIRPNSYSLTPLRRSFLLALSVCYHASLYNLEARKSYRNAIMDAYNQFERNVQKINIGQDWFLNEILKCQFVFIDEINMNKKNIAFNLALLENVFMMIICIELRIPLFIVGKPGSSKSLAKSIVARAMEGRNSKSALFQNLKETYFVNFQCSPLTTSEMIVKAFEEAARFQEHGDLNRSVAVVNLDEIGLAEGSESMPLKALHPLLEDGVEVSGTHGKVAVIGISNWALDPAKMNRGIFVSRGEPDIEELIESAKGICKYDKSIFDCIEPFIKEIAHAYLDVCQMARDFKREFFGLRDYYSLIKMIYWFCSKDRVFTWHKLEHAVKRNFNGLEIDALEPFKKYLYTRLDTNNYDTDPRCDPIDLIESALKGEYVETNSRYLLFLTENNNAIDIIQNYLINMVKLPVHNLTTIFGSSFRSDQQYAEICRNISIIKHSMEIGKTIILLNSYNLYESLYDALNQYYYEFAGQKYVDLGLGTHRIKCSVHENFRLIIIAEKAAVYDSKRFPIPLINRLEKHFLKASTMLNKKQIELVKRVEDWVASFTRANVIQNVYKPETNELFIGYHSDTASTLVLYLSELLSYKEPNSMETDEHLDDEIVELSKKYLLRCATPDSIIRSNESRFLQNDQKEYLWNEYFIYQKHLSFIEMLDFHVSNDRNTNLIQITTHSKSSLLNLDMSALSKRFAINDPKSNIDVCLLQSFDTQQQFQNKLRSFFERNTPGKKFLLVQSDLNLKYSSDLISCARHTIAESFKEISREKNIINEFYIALVIVLPKENVKSFIGFQLGGYWSCYHLDELEEPPKDIPPFEKLKNNSISSLLSQSLESEEENNEFDLSVLLKRLAHSSCSLIIDTNLSRTISRIDLFTKLCDDKRFTQSIVGRILSLQKEKEDEYMRRDLVVNWLVKEAASYKRINDYSTLRRAIQSYFESKLSPLLGYLLSTIDLYSNLSTLDDAILHKKVWKYDLWMNVLNSYDLLKLNYKEMRSKEDSHSKELHQFKCQSDWYFRKSDSFNQNIDLRPSLPFFWLLINQLNDLYFNFMESTNVVNEQRHDINKYAETISQFFENLSLYKLLMNLIYEYNETERDRFINIVVDSYLNDFILIHCPVNTERDLQVIKKIFKCLFTGKLDGIYLKNLKHLLPMIHFLFSEIKDKVEMYLKFSSYNSKMNECDLFNLDEYFSIQSRKNCLEIHLDSCIECIKLFKIDFKSKECFKTEENKVDRLFTLLQLIGMLKKRYFVSENLNETFIVINQQFESLTVLRYFIDVIIKYDKYETIDEKYGPEQVYLIFDEILERFKFYLNREVDFKSRDTIIRLNDFIVDANNIFNDKFKGFYSDYSDKTHGIENHLNLFYVNAIEALCFKNLFEQNQRIERDAIEVLLMVITDKKIIHSQTGAYFNVHPIYRSLIVQVLFRNYDDIVKKHLQSWFDKSSLVGQNEIFKSSEEICLLFQNCVYDQRVYEISNKIHDELSLANQICKDLIRDSKLLDRVFRETKMIGRSFDVKFLLIISNFKFIATVLAKHTYSQDAYDTALSSNGDLFTEFNNNMKNLIENSRKETNTLINFLIKQLIRKYGSSSIKFVLANTNLNWIGPSDIIGDDKFVNDKYVICGEKYFRCKDLILRCFKENNSLPLEHEYTEDLFPYLCIAFYQNVTLLYRNLDNQTNQIAEKFDSFLEKKLENETSLVKPLLYNGYDHYLHISDKNWSHIDLAALLIQIRYSIYSGKSALLEPLKKMIQEPKSVGDKYIPTMPQDSLFDIKSALQISNRNYETTRFYKCPNGHIYVIGNCGQPWVTDRCKDCGETIGGQSHKLLENNQRIDDAIRDTTLRGYCVDKLENNVPTTDANGKSTDLPNDIRLLDPISFHIERFFINACMYLACGNQSQHENDVLEIMAYKPTNLKNFFWEHMNKDLSLACKALNMTLDELIILLHNITNSFVELKPSSPELKLETKEERQTWEDLFNKNFLKPILTETSQVLTKSNETIREQNKNEDERQSKIYFMAYELLGEDRTKLMKLYENEEFWKYRPIVNFDLMSLELNRTTDTVEHRILRNFSKLNYQLQLLHNLPQMVRFVKFLKNQFNKSIFKDNARSRSIYDYLSSISLPRDWNLKQIESVIECFQNVWFYSKQKLNDYIHSQISNDVTLNIQLNHVFNKDTKLSYFLPTSNSDGLVCYALLHYLFEIQNEILRNYHSCKRLSQAHVKNAELFDNSDLLILFDKNDDLFRIVQSNFTYDSKNLKFLFRYENIEYQIIDKYLRNKPLIDIKTIPKFEYSDEINDVNVFIRLNEVNKQEMHELPKQLEILDEFRTINQLSEALNTLKIIINYAITTSAESNQSSGIYIAQFIKSIYLNETMIKNCETTLKSKIIESCQLKHLKNIWVLLMMKRSILYTLNKQDPFEELNSCFKKEDNIKLDLETFDQLIISSLTLTIYQIIIFVLSPLKDDDLIMYNQIAIGDMFSQLDELNILVPENIRRLPDFYPDTEFTEPQDRIKMNNVYFIWKQLCNLWRGNN